MFTDWVLEFDCGFMKFDSCPLSDLLRKMILPLKNPNRPKERESGGGGMGSNWKKAGKSEERKL